VPDAPLLRRALSGALPAFAAVLQAACAGPSDVPASAADRASFAFVDRVAGEALEAGVVGLSIGVAVDGETVYAAGFGHADVDRRHPASAETVYDAASVGKQFTAAAVLLLAERGRLGLDHRIRELVPEAPPAFPDATLRQLLTHTSGFVDGDLDEQHPPASGSTFRRGQRCSTTRPSGAASRASSPAGPGATGLARRSRPWDLYAP
jgi:CubicO group peptidase (beta-lactamase class C family)